MKLKFITSGLVSDRKLVLIFIGAPLLVIYFTWPMFDHLSGKVAGGEGSNHVVSSTFKFFLSGYVNRGPFQYFYPAHMNAIIGGINELLRLSFIIGGLVAAFGLCSAVSSGHVINEIALFRSKMKALSFRLIPLLLYLVLSSAVFAAEVSIASSTFGNGIPVKISLAVFASLLAASFWGFFLVSLIGVALKDYAYPLIALFVVAFVVPSKGYVHDALMPFNSLYMAVWHVSKLKSWDYLGFLIQALTVVLTFVVFKGGDYY